MFNWKFYPITTHNPCYVKYLFTSEYMPINQFLFFRMKIQIISRHRLRNWPRKSNRIWIMLISRCCPKKKSIKNQKNHRALIWDQIKLVITRPPCSLKIHAKEKKCWFQLMDYFVHCVKFFSAAKKLLKMNTVALRLTAKPMRYFILIFSYVTIKLY